MEKTIKIYSSSDKYKYYKIEEYKEKFYVKRFEKTRFMASDEWYDVGNARSLEDAITLARTDAMSFGSIYKVEFE